MSTTAVEPFTQSPFHESIIRALRRAAAKTREDQLSEESKQLLMLLAETKIPKGHAEIIAALDEYFPPAQTLIWYPLVTATKKELQKQLDEIEAEAKQAVKIDLEELEAEAKRLVSLLAAPEPGLISWHMALHERLHNLTALVSPSS